MSPDSGDDDITLILNGVVLNVDDVEDINSDADPYGIDAYGLNSLNIELVGENEFQCSDPDSADCNGIYTQGDFPVNIYGAGSLEISGWGIGDEYGGDDGENPINVLSGDLTLGKAGDSRTSLIVNGTGADDDEEEVYTSIYCDSSIEIVNADVTINDADWNGMYADEDITITDSTIKISNPCCGGIEAGGALSIENSTVTIDDADWNGMYADEDITITDSTINITDTNNCGIFCDGNLNINNTELTIENVGWEGLYVYGEINILGDSEIEINNAGSAAILADEGGKITLGKGLAILSPENGEIVSFSYDYDGTSYNAQTIALPDAAIEYDDGDNFFTGAAQSVKIGAGEPEPSFLEQLLGFFKKLAALINYLNTGIVILPSEF